MPFNVDTDLIYRTIINFISILLLVRCYYHFHTNREYALSFILFGNGVFFVTALLHSAEVSMGFAFGLFALFSMLRYRTESISVKEMTYLFLVIAIALLMAVSAKPISTLIVINTVLVILAILLEMGMILPHSQERLIEYEKIENIHPDRKQELLEDLTSRTGLNIIDAKIESASFLRDTALIRLHYTEGK